MNIYLAKNLTKLKESKKIYHAEFEHTLKKREDFILL